MKRKIYNDPKNNRSEIPEDNRRLHVSRNVMLYQRVALLNNDVLVWDLLINHIKNHPDIVYKHVYDYRSFPRFRIRIDSVGERLLFQVLDKRFPETSNEHRFFKRKQKAKMNVMKKLYPINKVKKK
jgi:hypothetical protein